MKAILILLLTLLSVQAVQAQTLVQRAGQANTVHDPNLFTSRSLRPPVFADTAAANTQYPTLDSAGKIIYTYDVEDFWYRAHNPKRWVRFGSRAIAATGSDVDTSGRIYYPGYGIIAVDDSTFRADTAQLATLWDLNIVQQQLDTTDTNFATHDLAATANRTHQWGTYTLRINQGTGYLSLSKRTTGDASNQLYSYANGTAFSGDMTHRSDYYELYHSAKTGGSNYLLHRRSLTDTGSYVYDRAVRGTAFSSLSLTTGDDPEDRYALLSLNDNAPGQNKIGEFLADQDGVKLWVNNAASDQVRAKEGLTLEYVTGQVRVDALKTTRTAPAQAGPIKYVTTDSAGRLSFADGVDTSGRTYYALNGLKPRNDSTLVLGGYLDEATRIKGLNTHFVVWDSLSGNYVNTYYSGYKIESTQQDYFELKQTYLASSEVRNQFYWNTTRMYFYNYLGQYSFDLLPESALAAQSRLVAIDSNDLIHKVGSVPEYADNAAATTAGLTAGALYHTAGTLKIVYTP